MAQKLLKTKKSEVAPRKDAGRETGIVLVGTYGAAQMEKWILPKGYYNYPVGDEDDCTPAHCGRIRELWLYKGKGARKVFSAEFVGVKTRAELPDYPATKTKPHGEKYLLFKVKELYGPQLEDAAVHVRVSDFAKRTPEIAAAVKAFQEGSKAKPETAGRLQALGAAGILAEVLPGELGQVPPERLCVREAALQLDFIQSMYEPMRLTAPNPRMGVKFIDLFCGVGGIRLGFDAQGFECVMSSDINTECQRTYSLNFCEMPWGDIQQIDENKVPDHQILCAGFPCQPFSISGKQRGFEDTRGTMFFEICRIINRKKPEVVFLENVKHLVHHDHGKTLAVILKTLEGLGYKVAWRVLNATDFGVPQNRERIIIVGSRRGTFDFDSIEKQPRTRLVEFLDNNGPFEFLEPRDYTLLDHVKQQEESGLIFAGYRNKSIRKAGVRPGTLHLSRVHKQPNRIYSVLGVHPTLPSQESSGRYFVKLEDGRVRKLTLRECWRIMGFPEEYQKVSVSGVQYKQLGNSVCVPMIRAVAKQIKEQFFKEV